jgi:hypothetical protein
MTALEVAGPQTCLRHPADNCSGTWFRSISYELVFDFEEGEISDGPLASHEETDRVSRYQSRVVERLVERSSSPLKPTM